MANVCTTQITISATKPVLDWVEEELKKFSDLQTENVIPTFVEIFGGVGESNIDKVGTKWITFDTTTIEREETELIFQIDSATYPPDVLIQNMEDLLAEKDPESYLKGRWWDESFSSIGVFTTESGDWEAQESSIDDIDFDDEYYWDNQVVPAFRKFDL